MNDISPDMFYGLIQTYGLPLLWAVIIFIVGRMIARIISSAVAKAMTKAKVEETLVKFTKNMLFVAIMVFVVIAAISKMGVETTSFAAVVAAAGLAIGLSLQGTLSNFASGVLLIVFRPFKTGDFIEAAGISGIVEEIQIFSTLMRSGDNKQIIVPNSQVMGTTITNYSTKPTRRLDLVIGVGYGDDLQKVKAVLNEVLATEERILPEPQPTIGVLALGESSVDFAVRPWVNSGDYWPVLFDLQEAIKLRFDVEGISIPFPQRDIHIVSNPKDTVAA
ncbi:mechanosensitive ion channel family protein [Pelovirga terrestris]|uniref:Mechanosensitive ion channel n=1 Tax=Pelovirga terrestris TaxID=2771352 RepID=A0A8J6QP47_9BACT|nr:mechanosensitive ion channel domain-containing protein [Pelovirga terrestris]MBD1399160.1 mechanosensitive ion channel [Pelovirga terrestris]